MKKIAALITTFALAVMFIAVMPVALTALSAPQVSGEREVVVCSALQAKNDDEAIVTIAPLKEEPETQNETPETVENADDNSAAMKALAAALVVGVVGAAGAIGMAIAIAKSTESMARQPEASSKINSAMMLGIVFIETAIIYALIVAILIIFVL